MSNFQSLSRENSEWNVRYRAPAMGCVASKLDINDVHPNMFAVVNVNDVSEEDSDLIDY